jgi:hypothetical protein
MLGTTDLALFVVAGLLLNVTPGPDTRGIFVVLGIRLAISR